MQAGRIVATTSTKFHCTRPASITRGPTVDHDRKPAPKSLVICRDGTGNETSENISNVLNLSLPAQDR